MRAEGKGMLKGDGNSHPTPFIFQLVDLRIYLGNFTKYVLYGESSAEKLLCLICKAVPKI